MFDNVKEKVSKSPLFKAIIAVFSLIVVSILSGAFITEITVNGSLNWNVFYQAKSFYGLIVFSFLIYFYYKFLYIAETSSEKFVDDEYCKAYMREKCLPEAARKVNELIKSGKDSSEVKSIVKNFIK